MAYRIISPKFSFVRFSDQHIEVPNWYDRQEAGADITKTLPVFAYSDLYFQFIVQADTKAEMDVVCTNTITEIQLGIYSGPPVTALAYSDAQDTWAPDAFTVGERYRLNDLEALYFVAPPDDLFLTVPVGQCFQMAIYVGNYSGVGPPGEFASAVSNVFTRVSETAHTTLMEYWSEKDEAEFIYCASPTIKNRIRLPLYLGQPTYPEEESIYRDSGGYGNINKSLVREVYNVTTDEFPAWWIRALRAVLVHDVVSVTSLSYTGDVVKEGDFSPEYSDYRNYPLARVAFKLAADEYLLKKNNCAECEDNSIALIDPAIAFSGSSGSVNLASYIGPHCCAPFVISVYSFRNDLLTAVTVTGLVVNYTARSPAGIAPSPLPPFIRLRVQCGGNVQFMDITI